MGVPVVAAAAVVPADDSCTAQQEATERGNATTSGSRFAKSGAAEHLHLAAACRPVSGGLVSLGECRARVAMGRICRAADRRLPVDGSLLTTGWVG